MIISDTAVRHRVSVMVLAIIILIFGAYSYSSLPREAEPDITIPYVFVSTSYKGVSASDIESSITIPIEKKLKGLEGVKKMQSVSSEGLSSVNIEFLTGTDIDDALQKVRNKVDEAKNDLPGDLENDPSVFEVNMSEMPIVVFSLSGTCGNPCLKDIAENLKDEIEGIPGVIEAEVTGGLEREIRIEVSTEKLAYYGIPITALEGVVSSENQNTSGGALRLGDGRYQLRVPGEFNSPEDLLGLIVGVHEGQPVYLKDIAHVYDGFKEEMSRSRLDGKESVTLSVKKRAGRNALEIIDSVDDIIQGQRHSWPSGTDIVKLMDRAKEIRTMIADLENNILSGLVLVVGVMFFALGLRNALLVSLAIPFSMYLTFMVLQALGITLNMVVLFSLTLALGMLVDNAIVIIENIYRHMQQGVPAMRAAMSATSEVAYPVIGSTLTTLVAFAPLMFWPGIMGEFMSYLPLTLIITLSSSLFVAMVINPALASVFMKLKAAHGSDATRATDAALEEQVIKAGEAPVTMVGPVLGAYENFVQWALEHRTVVITSSFLVLFLFIQIWLLAVGIEEPVEFFPKIDPDAMYVNLETPEGSGMEYNDSIVKKVEALIYGADEEIVLTPSMSVSEIYQGALAMRPHLTASGAAYEGPSDLDNVEHVFSTSVSVVGGAASMFEGRSPNHIGVQFLDFDERRISTNETLSEIRRRVKDLPGGSITVQGSEHGPPTGEPINIEISGDNYRMLGILTSTIKEILEKVPNVVDIRDDFEAGTPTIRVMVDRQKAALVGLNTGNIGFALKTGYNGLDVSTFRESGEDYDITVQLPEKDRMVTDVLRELMVPTPSGQMVPLTSIATIDYGGSIGSIVRVNNERVLTVKADVEKVPGPVVRAEAEKVLESMQLPPGYDIRFTGEFEFQKEAEDFLSKAFVVALFMIFLVLVTQFNSVSQPFIIMTAVMLSIGGAFIGLTAIGSPFGIIMSGVGVISLAGVVVNNGIVLVDYINKLRERGYEIKEAVILGGATRLRPVVLTAITTMLGLLPMVTGVSFDFHNMAISWQSSSSQFWRSMAIVVIFGLMVSTLLTLVVVPVMYSALSSIGHRAGGAGAALRRLYWRPYEKLLESLGYSKK